MECEFCQKTLDEFLSKFNPTPEQREAIVRFAMYQEAKRLENKIRKGVFDLPPVSKLDIIC